MKNKLVKRAVFGSFPLEKYPFPVFVCDKSGWLILVNKSLLDQLGVAQNDLTGRSMTDLLENPAQWESIRSLSEQEGEDPGRAEKIIFELSSLIIFELDCTVQFHTTPENNFFVFWVKDIHKRQFGFQSSGRETSPAADPQISNETEAGYRLIFNLSPLPVWIHRLEDFQIMDVNEEAILFYGYSREEFLGMTAKELRPPSEISKLKAAHQNLDRNLKRFRFGTYTHRKKNGELVRMEVIGSRISYQDEECMIISCWDVTVKESQLLAIQEYARKLRFSTELSKIGYWLTELKSGQLHWSDEVYAIWGRNKEDFPVSFETFFESVFPEDREKFLEARDQALQDRQDFNFAHRIIMPDLSLKWVLERGKLIFGEDGEPMLFEGAVQDIDAYKTLELRIRNILQSISDAFYAVDEQWKFTYFNKEAENLLKKREDEVLGRNIWEVFPQALGTPLEQIFREVRETGISASFEYLFPGDGAWYEINAYPSTGGVSAYFKNIDERKKNAEELARAYEERNSILESIGDGFIAIDSNWKVNYWNKMAERLLGKNRGGVLDHDFREIHVGLENTNFYGYMYRAIEEGKALEIEEYFREIGLWLEISLYPSRNGLAIYFKDVTERNKAFEQIKLSNERFEKITEVTHDAIWDWDIKNASIYYGKGFENIFGYDLSLVPPSLDFWSSGIHPEDIDRISASLRSALDDPSVEFWFDEFRFKLANGEDYAFVIDRGVVLRDESGQAYRMLGSLADITDRINYENSLRENNLKLARYTRELEQSNWELEQIAFVTSHDLQEPLRMITGFLSQLERRYQNQLDDKAHQYIRLAMGGSQRMKQIISDLMEYSRASKSLDEKTDVCLSNILEEYGLIRQKVILDKKVKIILINDLVFLSFRLSVTQVFHNLLDNAIKYSRSGEAPVIEIDAWEKEGFYYFSVKDNGIGIDPLYFGKIFEMFQRLHASDMYSGTGIGLAITKKLIENMGGEIWLESQEGVGTTFYFKLPKYSQNLLEKERLKL
jgi:PAS domain S-box-containing protein